MLLRACSSVYRERQFHIQRPLFCLCAAFSLGVLFYWTAPKASLILLLFGAAMAVLWLLLSVREKAGAVIPLCFLLFFGGYFRPCVNNQNLHIVEGKMNIIATVSGEAFFKNRGVRMYLTDIRAQSETGEEYHYDKAYWSYTPKVGDTFLPVDGQQVQFSGTVYAPRGQTNPYGFSFKNYLLVRNCRVGISGMRDETWLSPIKEKPDDVRITLRQSLSNKMDELFSKNAHLPKALLLGERDELADNTVQAFRKSGIAHILAISGLHVSLLAGMLLWLLSRFHIKPSLWYSTVAAFLLFYCWFLFFSASVVRASIMSLVFFAAKSLKKRSDTLTNWGLAMAVILLIKPAELLNVGFQLSFLATLGIITLGDSFNHLLDRIKNYRLRKALSAYAITLAATLMTLPVSINTFHFWSPIGLLYSPVAVFLVGLLMPLYIAVCLVSAFLPQVGVVLGRGVDLLTDAFLFLTQKAASAPFSTLRQRAIPGLLCVLILLTFFFISRYSLIRRKLKAGLLVATGLLALLYPLTDYFTPVTFLQLDVGTADCAVIEDGKDTYVLDTGLDGRELSGYLLSRGRKVTVLILTHLHSDHAGGVAALMENGIPVEKIYLPPQTFYEEEEEKAILTLLNQSDIPLVSFSYGDVLEGKRVSCRALWPHSDKLYPGVDENEHSLVTLWDLDGIRLLSMADVGSLYEGYSVARADILKAGHHGAKQGTSQEFLQAVSPELVIVPISQRDSERATMVVRRAGNENALCYLTGDKGAVIVKVRDGKASVMTYLED